jgi:branched-chain amino acid aminotransferase
MEAAAKALREVGERARVYVSMPVIEGVTPRALVDDPQGAVTEDPSGLPRKDGIFRLDEIGICALDHVALYGDGVFEGILIRNNSIFLYRQHMDRLDRSMEKVGIELPIDRQTLTERILETCRKVALPKDGAGYIRLVVTRGMGDLGINPRKCVSPTIFAIVSTIRLYSPDAYKKGIVLGLSRRVRRPDASVLDPNIKSNNYLNNVMALREGTRKNKLLEALMLTQDGFVAEATVDNIFSILRRPGDRPPPLEGARLPGAGTRRHSADRSRRPRQGVLHDGHRSRGHAHHDDRGRAGGGRDAGPGDGASHRGSRSHDDGPAKRSSARHSGRAARGVPGHLIDRARAAGRPSSPTSG